MLHGNQGADQEGRLAGASGRTAPDNAEQARAELVADAVHVLDRSPRW